MKKSMKHFEEMQLENLATIKGGLEIKSGNTLPNLTYPNGDNVDVTCYNDGTSKPDGMGGGTCSIVMDPTLANSITAG